MEKEKALLDIFKRNKCYARTGDVLDEGFHNHYLNVLVEQGKVVKIKRGLWRLASVSINQWLMPLGSEIKSVKKWKRKC